MSLASYKDLGVWQKAMCLVFDIYKLTQMFPKEELYGLVSQMRRAAVSIPSNIAEGRGRQSSKEFVRYVNIAYGSAAELETQILISEKIGYIDAAVAESTCSQLDEVRRMLYGLRSSLEEQESGNR